MSEHASRRVLRLKDLAVDARSMRAGTDRNRLLGHVVIEAANLWTLYCRFYFVSTALNAKDAAGNRTSISAGGAIHTPQDAIDTAVRRTRHRLRNTAGPFNWSDEPKWHITSQFLRLMQRVGSSNLATVHHALSYQPQSREDLITTRNFFAHKSERTADAVGGVAIRYGVPASAPAQTLLVSVQAGDNQPVLANWLDDLRGAIVILT